MADISSSLIDNMWNIIVSGLILLLTGIIQYWRDEDDLQDQKDKLVFVLLWLFFMALNILMVILSQDLRSQLLGFFGIPFSYGAIVQLYIKRRLKKTARLNEYFVIGCQKVLEMSLHQVDNGGELLKDIDYSICLPLNMQGVSSNDKKEIEEKLRLWTLATCSFVNQVQREEGASSQPSSQ